MIKLNGLQIFKNEQFGAIRTVRQNGEILFVAADICKALEIKDTSKAVARLDADEKGTTLIRTLGGEQNLLAVNEYGLYNLVLASRKPEAKAFKRWITHDVIPSIRKTGSYSKPAKQPTVIQQQRAEAMLLNAKSRQSKLWLAIADKTDIKEYKHICQQKAAEVLAGVPVLPMEEVTEKTYSATDIARKLGTSANRIGKIANQYNLKTPQYGKYFYSKSEHSCKEVETFRYYEKAIAEFSKYLAAERLVTAVAENTEEEFMQKYGK